MRVAHLVLGLSAFAAACGGKPGQSICDNTVPPPAVCMTQCDPSPSAPNSCPSGYHCAADGFCDALCTPTGGECGGGYICTEDGRCKGENECVGLECNIVDCTGQGQPDTTISGTVYAPNGTLPLYGIQVYVPNAPVGPLPDGAQCARCNEELPGNPLVQTTTNEEGKFTLTGVPAGTDIPLVISSGKWRRQITISTVNSCTDNSLPAADTRLPKDRSEGDIPRIALSTGDADALECILRRMGIADSEIGKEGGDQRVHLYTNVDSGGQGVDQFANGFPGGSGTFTDSQDLWSSAAKLKSYDIVILSCEGDHYEGTKTQDHLNAMKEYADVGGRIFLSHWHNIWIGGGFRSGDNNPRIASWVDIATWGPSMNFSGAITDIIDETNNPKGTSFANWMVHVMGSTVRGEIPIAAGTARTTVSAVDTAKAERWTYIKSNEQQPQNFQFTTPVDVPLGERCGKVVFSDMHVSGNGGSPGQSYPNTCGDAGTPNPLSPQEKALAFMLFDLASCVGVIL